MNELKTTLIFCFGAVALAAAAVVVDPGGSTPDVFDDLGQAFYPEFTDPQAPRAIEVVDYDEDTATATPLKVEFTDNKWVIPSHNNYPADAETRLADTAAALIDLKKDIVVSERVEDHADYGVVDPLDDAATSLVGRGKRVTLRDGDGEMLADFIIGKQMEGKPGYLYMRDPDGRKVYGVQTDAKISAEFREWIETDLLKLAGTDLQRVNIDRYSINERLGTLEGREQTTLTKKDGKWKLGSRDPNETAMNDLVAALEGLRIVDVQPKPEGLSADLKSPGGIQPTRESFQSLAQRGFFFTRNGQLVSNEGEIVVDAKNGIRYVLRFGEIADAGAAKTDESGEPDGVRRYLFITAEYSEARAKQYAGEGSVDEKGKELAEELRERFAGWYYVISGADFDKLRPSRRQLRG